MGRGEEGTAGEEEKEDENKMGKERVNHILADILATQHRDMVRAAAGMLQINCLEEEG